MASRRRRLNFLCVFATRVAGDCRRPMRAFGIVATVLLIAVAACGRSSLVRQPPADASSGGNGPDGSVGSGGAMNGTGGQTQGTTAGTGGAVHGSGGAPGFGGAMVTGGKVGTGGRVGTGGTGGTAGTNRTGGAVGAGGISATGGTRATGGFFRTGGAMATGGVAGVGGIATNGGSLGSGGRLGSGGLSGGAIGAGGTSASGGVVSAGGMTTSGGTTGTGGSCGNGMVGPGEQCDLGVDNGAASAFWVTQSGRGFAAVPLMRFPSASDFYDYASASAHTGLESVGTSRILLYLDKSTLALSLFVIHGQDKDGSGLDQPKSHVQMQFTGLPSAAFVDVSDDSDELWMTSPTAATGFWIFTSNSDGGVLSGLPFPGDWEITIEPTFVDGISTWTWVQSDSSLVNLDMTQPLTIKARNSSSRCRLDCTAPQCGDGILDGGEICDDGSQPTSGCSGDCMGFD
jgi:hypothetical protein